jgi:hypothetical protein
MVGCMPIIDMGLTEDFEGNKAQPALPRKLPIGFSQVFSDKMKVNEFK